MKKGRESIDIFKIYKENKLHPSIKQNHEIKDFHRDDNIKIRNKTPILKRIEKQNPEHKAKRKSPKLLKNNQNLLNNPPKEKKIKEDRKQTDTNLQNMFEEIKSLNCFLDEIKKNLSSKFTIEEICNILQNRLYKLSQYENIIAPKKHSNEEKCFQKNINIAENITDRLKNSISENNLNVISERIDHISILKNKILSRRENSKSPYTESFLE